MLRMSNARGPMALLCIAVVLGALTGCQTNARIAWNTPDAEDGPSRDVAASDLAQYSKSSNVVGKHTFTLFAIPLVPINSDTPIDEAVAEAVVDAMETANYNVILMDEPPADAPYLTGTVKKFRYWSYMWLWPLMIEGGAIKYELSIVKGQGEPIWTSSFKASAGMPMLIGAGGYNGMIKRSMTNLVGQIKDAAMTEEFGAALGQ